MGFLFRRRPDAASTLEDTLKVLRSAAFFAPTPWAVAREMLEFAQVQPGDLLYDLGSGDGRIPIMAAQEFGCRAVGIELDEKLRHHAEVKVKEYGLEKQVSFKGEDFFRADLRDATVVTLYLLTAVNGYLGPRLASQLPKGARVVCLDYEIPGWRFIESRPIKSEGNVDYTIYLYQR
jgi:hypothetical protein